MKNQNLLLLILSILLTSTSAFASVPAKTNEKAKLLEELTGKKAEPAAAEVRAPAASQPAVAAAPMAVSRKHLNAGFQAYTKKDYITALKHYNTILVKHGKSADVKSAYLAKAKLYQEMGLIEQAQYNVKLAQDLEKKSK